MPRKVRRRDCYCGCGGLTAGGEFLPGHDRKLEAAIVAEVGGIIELHQMAEKVLKRRIKVKV